MSGTTQDYVRNLEDARHILTPLLRVLVQKRLVRAEEAFAAIGASLRKVLETIQADVGALLLSDKNGLHFHIKAMTFNTHLAPASGKSVADLDARALQLKDVELTAEGVEQKAIEAGLVYVDCDVASCMQPFLREFRRPVHSLIVVPLRVGKRSIGAVEFVNRTAHDKRLTGFSDEDVALAHNLGIHAERLLARVQEPDVAIPDRELAGYVARLSRSELATELKPDMELMSTIGAEKLRKHLIVPLASLGDNGIRAALADPLNFQQLSDFQAQTGFRIQEKVVAAESDIRSTLERHFPETSRVTQVAERISKEYAGPTVDESQFTAESNENSALIINLANRIIEDAHHLGASDIHVEPLESKLIVRYRIDGVCRIKLALPKAAHRPLVSRLKVMSELDIAEHRLPQDGKINFKKFSPRYELDLRVSVAPMQHGEAVVLRILDRQRSTLPLNQLGFSDYNLRQYRSMITAPYGMILHCGPTGSGKSMTLYAALNEINSPEWKVLTAEDPIEYSLPGINQLQVKPDIGLTFAAALRCFLRQDPDIILVGEIRDRETAEIAIEAALTGHILFSTLHSNDACSTIVRLVEIGIEPFLVATSLVGICAQRLVRRLCTCKQHVELNAKDRRYLEAARDSMPINGIYVSGKCDKCERSGYKGRTGIHELLKVSEELRELIGRGATTDALKKRARAAGMHTLFEDVMEKVKSGTTSMSEALTTAWPDEDFDPLKRNGEAL